MLTMFFIFFPRANENGYLKFHNINVLSSSKMETGAGRTKNSMEKRQVMPGKRQEI